MTRPRWYTVPAEYGGLSLPWHRRLYVEWLWRRHGAAGLDAYLVNRWQRTADRLGAELVPAFEKATEAVNGLGVSFAELGKTLSKAPRVN